MLKTAFFKRSYIAVQIFCTLINLEWLSGIKWCAALSKQTLYVCMLYDMKQCELEWYSKRAPFESLRVPNTKLLALSKYRQNKKRHPLISQIVGTRNNQTKSLIWEFFLKSVLKIRLYLHTHLFCSYCW